MRAFKLTEREPQPGCKEIRVEGELDMAVADRLREAIEGVGPDFKQILICFEECEFIDSTGIAIVVRAHHQLSDEGRRVAIYGPSGQVLHVLSITGLTENGLVFENAEEALSSTGDAAARLAEPLN